MLKLKEYTIMKMSEIPSLKETTVIFTDFVFLKKLKEE